MYVRCFIFAILHVCSDFQQHSVYALQKVLGVICMHVKVLLDAVFY